MAAPDDLYNQILADGPSPGTLYRLLLKLKEEGQSKRVIREGVKALKVYPSDLYIRKLLAETYFEVGHVAQAQSELEKLLQQFETFVSAYKLQAEILHQQKKEGEVAKNLKLYLAHRPDDQEAIETLQALDLAEEPVVIEPTPSFEEPSTEMEVVLEGKKCVATPTLGEVFFSQGLIYEAIHVYEKIVEQNPDDERAKTRLEELKSVLTGEYFPADQGMNKRRGKKEKLLAVLEAWRTSIREMAKKTDVA
jgi:tetratricopeptide (TPR) repeat protein